MESYAMHGVNAPVQAELPPKSPSDSDDPKTGYGQTVPPSPPKPKPQSPGA
jgi:hypothetical protein